MRKKGMEMEFLGWALILLAVLVILVLSLVFLKGKGFSLIDKIQELWRFK